MPYMQHPYIRKGDTPTKQKEREKSTSSRTVRDNLRIRLLTNSKHTKTKVNHQSLYIHSSIYAVVVVVLVVVVA